MLQKSPVKCLLAGSLQVSEALEHQSRASTDLGAVLDVVPISDGETKSSLTRGALRFHVDEQLTVPSDRPGIVFFSSGSSGTPKGVVHSRALFHDLPRTKADESILVHRRPVWIAGSKSLLTAVLTGARAEIIDPTADPEEFWERFRAKRVTRLVSTVILWDELAKYYRDRISHLPNKEEYVRGVQHIRKPGIGGSVCPPRLLEFWRTELGLSLVVVYAFSEAGYAVASMHADDTFKAKVSIERKHRGLSDLVLTLGQRCIGKPHSPAIELKLSLGDHGELLTKNRSCNTFLG